MNTMDQRFKEINEAKNKKFNNIDVVQEHSDQNNLKSELISDLLATTTIMEELWKYHPNNPKKQDIEKEYKLLIQIQEDIEKELEEIE
tara:strand:- start:991 stop:1254 length:264 start_codon:yes stop_codon:yes gene_type:complete